MGVLSRFRAWLASVEFAVTATAVALALAGGGAFLALGPESSDAYFVLFLAGVTVPNVYADSWTDVLDSRLAGVAWTIGACVAVVACYLVVAAGLRLVAGETVATVASFVGTWLLALLGSRAAV
ncbi:hypothetical protein [Halobacterium sp. CBA1126]|uniref:hypothetical protein n=1 Tax=Halobacterium TaxID=2239 RepID=UPI0012F88BA9|nr:hypothetical protein [Halobacterium sp. CBA1126]MUV61066.1 hypothetical protein [Halobacterium sp. CBA1126]